MIAVLALLLVQAPAAAPAPPASPAATATLSAEARAFGEAYVPAEATTRAAVASFRTEGARALAQQPMLVTIEQRNPGTRAKLLDIGATVVERNYRERLPGMQQRIAAVAAANLSAADLRDVTRFLLSPTGQAAQNAVAANVDTAKIAAAAKTNGALTTNDLTGSMNLVGSLQAMTPAQIGELAKFSATPAGRRFQAVVPKLQAAVTDETNKLAQAITSAVGRSIMMTMRSLTAPAKGK
ncbi:hypothetical protein QLH51_16660 [Sphingomonas sp. 2R-10]|uniref:hypothetical protein n=1 Tax=Sphingomonas sp. 2R-10 TaxID=3045148 RepID=UPI000F7987EC|nr:hypothetical protein [Sphingomonas sp. 2R-10]MDJ0278431.1 hypothetical protein [Sphingomonas sp. 2R-10]